MKLLCAADLHLGRIPSRVPADLPIDRRELAPAAAWRELVRTAVRERADAVLLAGDVVEDRRDFYEAYADLAEGIAKLREAMIPVFAVSGNHDVDVLPRLADEIGGIRLLGRGGRWECVPLQAGGRQVRLLGWSFPAAQVHASPLESGIPAALLQEAGAGPVVGLLHGDRDGAGPYAPFRSQELAAAPVGAWILGHVHRPDVPAGGRPMSYLGSLSAGDPGEDGVRGAWWLRLDDDGAPRMERLPLSPIRYEELAVPLDDLREPEQVSSLVLRALEGLPGTLADRYDGLRAVGCRLVFTGRTRHLAAVRRVLSAEDPVGTVWDADGLSVFVHAWRMEARPDVDLAALADGSDPVAIVARTVLTLREGDAAERRALLAELRPRLQEIERKPAFARLDPEPWSEQEAAERLQAVALRVLDDLLAQRSGGSA